MAAVHELCSWALTDLMPHRGYVALGSNVGDKLRHLNRALRALGALPGLRLTRTSSLYTTAAQYVREQPAFLNAVVEVELARDLQGLLVDLKAIENDLGRRRGTFLVPVTWLCKAWGAAWA